MIIMWSSLLIDVCTDISGVASNGGNKQFEYVWNCLEVLKAQEFERFAQLNVIIMAEPV